ncbi:hypothetical protein RK892_02905, partial [Streptococcus pneumoniae]|nr:hypothetical protein [Streptococcus pneumoniae]MDS4780582.1 hypothetical protein [Streptococcus pneumoniae]MDS5088932.1 hypothetical protein [Streptococcus pneumoniae]MDS5326168.1 hypothetical protein [Streptococcus pneumoniae]
VKFLCFVVYCFHKNSITLFTVTEQVYYLRSIVSIVSAIDSSEAMLLPTINVLELLDKSQPFEEE